MSHLPRHWQVVACIFLLIFAAGLVLAQANDATTLPADQIVEILKANPSLLSDLKYRAAQQLQLQGRPVQVSDISDEEIFDRLGKDANLRAVATEQLKIRGYVSPSEANPGPSEVNPTSAKDSGLARTAPPKRKVVSETSAGTPVADDPNRPKGAERGNPYPDNPALRELYSQLPAQDEKLGRFGLDLFRNSTGNLDSLPVDLPVGPEYVLGPGDGLNIDLWGGVSQRFSRTVDRLGRIDLPEAGTLTIAGKTLEKAQQDVQRALAGQFRDAKVDLSLTRVRTVRVYVVGDVQRPGAYDISSLSTPLNALYIAGGPTSRGSLRKIRQYRGQQLVREVDLYDFLLRGIRSDVEKLQAGDTILVPPVGPEVAVAGMVRRPAVYELKSDTNIQDVLELAGGVLVSANLNQIEVERIEAHQRRVSLSVNLPVGAATKSDVAGGGYSEAGALGSFRLQDGDKVRVSSILPYSNETLFLEGHVFRPGKYSYRPGMKISDLVKSYDDVLPEPADHAEIVRLAPPDYRPATIEVDIRKALAGTADPELRPFDTVRIFGRYEIDPPKVAIFGEVLRPGEYPLAHDLTAAALVRMAGGFKRSALKDSADLSSYVIQNGQKILTKQRTILIGEALSGQTDADVNLKPGDVLTIRQLTGWADIGSSVTIKGEVVHAGTYGIQEGERLSSVLERAGGFRSIAFPAGAVLERVEVRQLEDKNRTELIRQVESAAPTFKVSPGKSEDQAALMQAMQQQQEQVVTTLRKQPASGRLVINISADINRWKNTPADIELRADDVLVIPKRPDFVLINGQVYNPSAITYAPGKDAGWYLRQAGGTNELANKKSIFIIRANGSVVGSGTAKGWFKGDVLSTRMQPGDTVVVPQKTIGGSSFWKQLVDTAQLTSALAIAARVATSF